MFTTETSVYKLSLKLSLLIIIKKNDLIHLI